MPPPSNEREFIEPPPEVIPEAMKGFGIGALRYASLSVLLHLVLSMPHPMILRSRSSSETTVITPEAPSPSHQHAAASPSSSVRVRLSRAAQQATASTSTTARQTPLLYRPLQGLSSFISPASKIYRGLTPQFKVFIQIGFMSLGGYIWAESRVNQLRERRRYERRLLERQTAAMIGGGY
ncbi:hypothetical protein KEM54_005885 [Ascosphaera aggregata]|nr:hypothetical protein KEM54_005885 [Ascosphaera aggregata]